MLIVERKVGKIVKGTHCVYTVDEADERGIGYVHWMHGQQGDWVRSDDGYVVQLLDVKEYYDSRRSKISRFDVYTIFYTYSVAKRTHWHSYFTVEKSLRGMGAISGKPWQERFVKSRTGRRWIVFVATMLLDKNPDMMAMAEFLGFDKKYPESSLIMVKRYLRDRLIEKAIMVQMSQFLNEKGITYDKVLEEYQEILAKAKADGKYSDALKILEKFERWTGLNQKISGDKIEHSREQDMVGQHIDKMLAERMKPKELIGGEMGLKVPASAVNQVFDADGKRVEYIKVNQNKNGDIEDAEYEEENEIEEKS